MTNTFAQAVFASALVCFVKAQSGRQPLTNGDGSIDCTNDIVILDAGTHLLPAIGDGTLTEQECLDNYDWIQLIYDEAGGFCWDNIIVTTLDGWDLSMVHFYGDADCVGLPNQNTFKPVLFIHDIFEDGTTWFMDKTRALKDAMPIILYEKGHDVYILNKRTTMGTSHDTYVDTDMEFWNFTMDDIANHDIPTAVEGIMQYRMYESYDAQPVQIVASGSGSTETVLYLASQMPIATDVSQAIVTNPALVYMNEYLTSGLIAPPDRRILSGVDIDADGNERKGRSLRRAMKGKKGKKGKSPKSQKSGGAAAPTNVLRHRSGSARSSSSDSCHTSKSDYNDRRRELRYELTYQEYKDFYKLFSTARRDFGKGWQCDYNWEDLLNEALCAVNNTFDVCQPTAQAEWAQLMEDMYNAGLFSLYGPNFTQQIADFCEESKVYVGQDLADNPEYEDSAACDYLQALDADVSVSYASSQISLKYWDHLVQQTWYKEFAEYNPDFNTNGWYTPGILYDLSTIMTPIQVWMVLGDMNSDEDCNRDALQELALKMITFNDGVTTNFSGQNDRNYMRELRLALGYIID